MKSFFIKTLGCKTNQLESAVIEEKLLNAGFVKSSDKDCDMYILNSCSVTHTTDNDSLKLLHSVKSNNKKIYTVLTGCFAQLQKESLENNPDIDLLLGNDDKFDIVNYLQKEKFSKVSDIMTVKNFNVQMVHDISKTRANLKIQDGCNNRCAYCTIPFARGFSRSNTIGNIVEQINIYTEHNFKEIILTGIHIGQWGQDFDKPLQLVDLLKEIEKTSVHRYRLGSLNPLEITDDLLEFLAQSSKFCPHFHLSLQSANNKILELMNRKYSVEFYLEQIKKINSMFKLPFLGADIIVGFPNETDEDFEVSRKNLENSNLSKIHVFPYSKRSGTVAFGMPNQVKESVKKQRAQILQKISQDLFEQFLKKNLGQKTEVIFEKHFDKNGFLKGLTPNYINVISDNSNKNLLNSLTQVELKEIKDNKILATVCEQTKIEV